MPERSIKTRIKHRINSREAWEQSSLSGQVLLNGELAFVKNDDGAVGLKVGDGMTQFSSLPYVQSPALSGKQDILAAPGQDWRMQPNYVPRPGQIVIWTDKSVISSQYEEDGEVKTVKTIVPGFKVGDGFTKNVDLPFVGEEAAAELRRHEQSDMHVTAQERASWSNKICIRDVDDTPESGVIGETLVLTRD